MTQNNTGERSEATLPQMQPDENVNPDREEQSSEEDSLNQFDQIYEKMRDEGSSDG